MGILLIAFLIILCFVYGFSSMIWERKKISIFRVFVVSFLFWVVIFGFLAWVLWESTKGARI